MTNICVCVYVYTYLYGFLGDVGGKNTQLPMQETRNEDWIPGLGRPPPEGHGNPLQYSCLENPIDQRSLAGYYPLGSQRVRHD